MAKKITAFFSWQSDSPEETNTRPIRKAIDAAIKRLAIVMPAVQIARDEATRGTSGSPNIALKILEKILNADLFIADITTVTSPDAATACPNPNVVFELGFAVAELGWDRVILLFNKEHGKFPADLPFDFIQNRASPITISAADPASGRDALTALMSFAIRAVIELDPKRPAELRGLSPFKIKHDHDVANMKWLMSAIHIPTLDDIIADLPHMVRWKGLWFFEHARSIENNSLFSVYDPALKAAVDRLFIAWTSAFSHGERYHGTASGNAYIFSNPGDGIFLAHQQKAWDDIEAARPDMRSSLDDLLARLREGFLEVDLNETNAKAWSAWLTDKMDDEAFEKRWAAKTREPKKRKKSKKVAK